MTGDKIIQLITVIPRQTTLFFLDKKRVSEFDTMPHIHPAIKKKIKEYIKDNVGYDVDCPIAGLSRYNGNPGELKQIGTSVSEYIPTLPGSTLWQLHMPEDMVVSINFEDLLTYSKSASQAVDEFDLELILEEFSEKMSLGFVDGDDVISFIPFIDLNRCKFYAMVDKSWGISDFTVPGVEQVKLTSMDMFV